MHYTAYIIYYVAHYSYTYRNTVSVRDLLSWVTFMNTVSTRLAPSECYYHGARLVFVDSLMTETGDLMQLAKDRDLCIQFLSDQLSSNNLCHPLATDLASSKEVEVTSDFQFGISPFYISKGEICMCSDIRKYVHIA